MFCLKITSESQCGTETSRLAPGNLPLPQSVIKTWPSLFLISLCLDPFTFLTHTGLQSWACVCVLIHNACSFNWLHPLRRTPLSLCCNCPLNLRLYLPLYRCSKQINKDRNGSLSCQWCGFCLREQKERGCEDKMSLCCLLCSPQYGSSIYDAVVEITKDASVKLWGAKWT